MVPKELAGQVIKAGLYTPSGGCEGIGHCGLGYPAVEPKKAVPGKENRVYRVYCGAADT